MRVGPPAPDFTGVDSNGNQHTLRQYKGKTVVLEWTNHDCPYVKKHYNSGNMQQLQQQATADGVVWLSVISSRPGKQGHVSGAKANKLTQSRNAAPNKRCRRDYYLTTSLDWSKLNPSGTFSPH